MPDLRTFFIERIIIHEVPRRVRGQEGEQPMPTLSEVESPLDIESRNYFREKIVGCLTTVRSDVVHDPSASSPIPPLVLDGLGPKERDFVTASQEMARHLYECQTGSNPGGLLAVIEGTIGEQAAFVIMKLEKEAGVRIIQDEQEGKRTFNVEHVRDLMFTEKTKVFKVGLFVQDGDDLSTLTGMVADNQISQHSTTGVAHFFLRQFLGFVLREAPQVTTGKFYDATQVFINNAVSDASTKARYQIALLAEASADTATLDPWSFANRGLERQDRQRYIEHLQEAGVPTQSFQKDITLIAPRLKRMQLSFDSGVVVLSPPGAYDAELRVVRLDDGRVRATIEDGLTNVRGRS